MTIRACHHGQYTQGDTNKAWQIYWSDGRRWSRTRWARNAGFFYDDKTRLSPNRMPLETRGRCSMTARITWFRASRPLNETNQAAYDSHHNMVLSIDPLTAPTRSLRLTGPAPSARGWARKDRSLRLQCPVQHDWPDPTARPLGSRIPTIPPTHLSSRTDSGGTTSYGYDSKGVLSSIAYPGSLGSEGVLNNAFGDVFKPHQRPPVRDELPI